MRQAIKSASANIVYRYVKNRLRQAKVSLPFCVRKMNNVNKICINMNKM